MEESIRQAFGLEAQDLRQCAPLTLAFVGDAVHELVIRTNVACGPRRQPRHLHDLSAAFARASAQAKMAELVKGMLTEEEESWIRRGRNAHAASIAKSASVGEYRRATGWECLIGFLYLSGQEQRAIELICAGVNALDHERD